MMLARTLLRQGGVSVRRFSNRQSFPPSTYVGPYTPEQVEQLEAFAAELKSDLVDQKLVNPWIRAKLGPYFRDGWTTRVAARKQQLAIAERQSQRPQDSTHFVVSHSVAAAETNSAQPNELTSQTAKLFAVVGLAGTQFKVVPGDVIVCNRIPSAQVGTRIELTDVLMVGSPTHTHVGRPNVPGWFVTADVEQQAREKKRLSFYKQPKTFSQKMRGFRREVTILRIGDICQVAAESSESSPVEDNQEGKK